MTVQAKLVSLVELLLDGTAAGDVSWNPARGENEFLSSGPNSGVKLSRWMDDDGDYNYGLYLLNPRGTVVAELVSEWDTSGTASQWNASLEELYDQARRQALGIDDLLDRTLADLQSGTFKDDVPF
ncbi:hypothetical protein NMK34_29445 [Micromonospora sp. BRA006-A]|uniref:hypothetical protein n=1 Tax=Micromonospora sp. BRA006-A TaxID=2962860 RepID=UPI00297006EF|nr:hypothetical protein [Micromonospora sp. BRA006-A]MDW3850743.1 hypothetical protein [Micromonospora sp. BRA006-A]